MIAAARRRLAAHRAGDSEDGGFALVYVMLIITIITVLVGSSLVITASNIVPSVQTAYKQAADAAAQGGLQAALAHINTACSASPRDEPENCIGALTATSGTIYSNDGYAATYTWTPQLTDDRLHVRITSTGTVSKGGITESRTLTADLAGGASTSCLDYGVCTQYETQSPDVMAQQFPSRTVQLSSTARAAANAVSGSGGNSVSWNGASTTDAAGSVKTCNAIYLGANGRRANQPTGGNGFVDWSESGSLNGTGVTSLQPCQVSLGSSTKLLAPSNEDGGTGGYYSRDALLFSNSNPGSSDGPLLDQPVYTGYQGSDDPGGVAGQNYRSFDLTGYDPPIGGTPASGSTYPTPSYVSSGPTGISASPSVGTTGACVYTGPTRVRLNTDGTATITSPLTKTKATGSPAGCYPASVTSGIYGFTTVALTSLTGFSGIFSVANSGTAPGAGSCGRSTTGWQLTCLKKYKDANGSSSSSQTVAAANNTVFYTDSGTVPGSGDPSQSTAPYTCTSTYSASTGSTCSWTGVYSTTDGNGTGSNGWTSYSSGTNCSNPATTDRLIFECEFNGGSVGTPHDYYGIFRDRVRIDLSRSTCLSGSVTDQQTCVKTFLTNELNPANNSSHRYIVTASTPVSTSGTKTLSANAAPLSGDAFFDSTSSPGTPSTETLTNSSFTFTIGRQIQKCYGVLVLGICLLNVGGPVLGLQWGTASTAGASVPQFTVTVFNQNVSNFSAGATGKSYFPYLTDVTHYNVGSGGATGSNGPGDLYVEGTATRSLALVAANDVVVTGNLRPATATSDGVEVVGQNNVRVYHPVSCTSPEATSDANNYAARIYNTTAGFCPNDVTGLYTSIPSNNYRPYQQYANLRPDLAGITLTAAIFALGNATSTVPCLQWNGSGTCGGQFSVDNYGRGGSLGELSVTGTIAQIHHGALGEEWEVPDLLGQTRPQSGYSLSVRYQNLTTLISGVNTVDVSGSAAPTSWHIVSVSTGGGGG